MPHLGVHVLNLESLVDAACSSGREFKEAGECLLQNNR